jgi:capsular exopolysaccharide synthesis family protein
MSRIEEALRRVDPAAASDRTAEAVLDDRAVRVRGSELDQYSPEEPRAVRFTRSPAEPERRTQPVETAREQWAAKPHTSDIFHRLTVTSGAPGVSVEQYRKLAATLYQAKAESGLKSLMVCSALPREGKTLTTANLALTLSDAYRQRVLLIDADLRSPAMHDVFGLPVAPGLADFLGTMDMTLPVVPVSETLTVITAGAGNGHPLAGLVSARMKALIADASGRYDWVLVDTPPIGILPDANLVAGLTEAVVFVVAAESTPYPIVHGAITAIGTDRIIGVVLNKVSTSTLPTSRYYDRYASRSDTFEGV